jgi:hypothetical protein
MHQGSETEGILLIVADFLDESKVFFKVEVTIAVLFKSE